VEELGLRDLYKVKLEDADLVFVSVTSLAYNLTRIDPVELKEEFAPDPLALETEMFLDDWEGYDTFANDSSMPDFELDTQDLSELQELLGLPSSHFEQLSETYLDTLETYGL
jgi:hypothetical protein